jgi:hypothetical protein
MPGVGFGVLPHIPKMVSIKEHVLLLPSPARLVHGMLGVEEESLKTGRRTEALWKHLWAPGAA